MQLERVAVELRPRSAWEGVDLGVAMWQRWRRSLSVAWAFLVLPLSALLLVVMREVDWVPRAALGRENALFACVTWWLCSVMPIALVLWCATPLLQRVVVHVLARALFGDEPRVIETLRATPRLLGRHFWLGALAHRFDPRRAVIQPVAQLEDVPSERRVAREGQLARQVGSLAWLASAVALLFQIALSLGALGLLLLLLPGELLPELDLLFRGDLAHFDAGWLTHAARIAWVLAFCVMGPLDAAIGFGHYVNARTKLEGWDVEVAFWRLGARVAKQRQLAEVGTTLIGCMLAAVLLATSARAQGTAQDDATQQAVEHATERALAGEEFEMWQEVDSWQLESADPDDSDMAWLAALAPLFEVLLWGALLAALVFIAVVVAKRVGWIEFADKPATAAPERPTHLFGLDLRPESLPSDIPTAALELWRRGEAVAALGLLYRAAISRLIERDGLVLESSDTEHDCLRRAKRLPVQARYEYFRDVTRAWQTCAYSSARPANETVEQLCADWLARFEGAAA